jgi:adenosylmethionine-8-amino-7-oxononanoate aminotransferase
MTAADPERWKFCGHAFVAERYGVVPDMICFAKGVTNGAAPLGGVLMQGRIHEAFMQGPEHVPELAHGFTYSGHPLGVAAANASLDLYRDEGLFERGLAPALIATESDIASIAERLRRVLSRLG